MFTDGAVRQLSDREFLSLGAATEKRRAAMSMLCGEMERKLCVIVLMIVTNATDCTGESDEQGRPVDEKRSPDNRDYPVYSK